MKSNRSEKFDLLYLDQFCMHDIHKINIQGTGPPCRRASLGLYVAKQIVPACNAMPARHADASHAGWRSITGRDAHHGKIWAESEGVDKGSRFIVEL